MSSLEKWPYQVPVLMDASSKTTSLSSTLHSASNPLPIKFEGGFINVETVLNVDTVKAVHIDKETRSWTLTAEGSRITLCFDTVRIFNAFLFAICFSRWFHPCTPAPAIMDYLSKARHALVSEPDHHYLITLSRIFVEMRAKVFRARCRIDSLPVEVMSLIFLFCNEELSPPLLLSQVCSRWRTIATETPRLWRTPSFVLGLPFFRNRDSHQAYMAAWLERAGVIPVSLSLTVPDIEYLPHQVADVTQYNPRFFDRMHNLRVTSPPLQLSNLLGGAAGHAMPELRSVSMNMAHWNPRQWPSDARLFRRAPVLRDLTIDAQGPIMGQRPGPGFMTAFPWSQLTTLTLKLPWGISSWYSVLGECKSLCIGRFIIRHADPLPFYPREPLVLNCLESLRFTFKGSYDLSFLGRLVAPAIQSLHVTGCIRKPLDVTKPFVPAFRTLKTLHLDVPDLPPRLLKNTVAPLLALERFSFILDDEVVAYTEVFELLLARQLWTLAITIAVEEKELDVFIQNVAGWAVQQTRTYDREFRLHSTTKVHHALKEALADEDGVQVRTGFAPDADGVDFDDPFDIFPCTRQDFVSVRRRAAVNIHI
ncbi:hypothetical protein B0H13DRAFT_2368459 [Mycena leptocephala]|nr:hypothetical protein B0H13DRAFT_2368459 [Mycena leptocephala]